MEKKMEILTGFERQRVHVSEQATLVGGER